jgi:hypothetical protein
MGEGVASRQCVEVIIETKRRVERGERNVEENRLLSVEGGWNL